MPIKEVADRRHDIAIVLLLPVAGIVWNYFHPTSVFQSDPAWFDIAFATVLVVISIGMWRAWEWARWACGLVGIFSSARLFLSFGAMVLKGDVRGASSGVVALALVPLFALFWAAIAFYCLRPSTGKLFAYVRASRARAAAARS